MTDIETIIVVHPPFAWLLDWPAIVSPTQRWYLVTTPASLARLQREDKLRAFCATHASSTFSEQALAPIIEPWVRAQPDSSRVRILSMIEPVQLAVAQLRERFATPGPSLRAATTFTNKLAMKSAMTGVDDLLPAHVAFDRSEFERAPHEYARAVFAKLGGPLFVKPLAENSSVDTARIDDPQQLVAHLTRRALGPRDRRVHRRRRLSPRLSHRRRSCRVVWRRVVPRAARPDAARQAARGGRHRPERRAVRRAARAQPTLALVLRSRPRRMHTHGGPATARRALGLSRSRRARPRRSRRRDL